MKKALKVILCIILAVALLAAGYLAYVLIDYHRIGDQELSLYHDGNANMVQTDSEYTLVSWNIGFGAYESDYGFFMDGGSESWAWSEERLNSNLAKMAALLADEQADFYALQEVDRDATRTYHVDEMPIVGESMLSAGYDSAWAYNYDSPFLLYPFTQPHGKSVSGLATFADFNITAANRVELPVESSVMKLVDLDRCYMCSHIPVLGGRELVLYNMHLSAYTSDGTIATQQLQQLIADMQSEYEKGNYVICSGDFNKDLLGDSSLYFGKADLECTWAQPLPEGIFDDTNLTLTAPLDQENPVPSCRNADGPYHPGQFVVTVDGFIVSDNVTVSAAQVLDTDFAYSDHNPVKMTFCLNA